MRALFVLLFFAVAFASVATFVSAVFGVIAARAPAKASVFDPIIYNHENPDQR